MTRWLGGVRPTGPAHRPTMFELLFDLVYVFAATQVTAFIVHEHSAVGVFQGLLVIGLMWWTWAAYTWLGNQARADQGLLRAGMAPATLSRLRRRTVDPRDVRGRYRRPVRPARVGRRVPAGEGDPPWDVRGGRRRRRRASASGGDLVAAAGGQRCPADHGCDCRRRGADGPLRGRPGRRVALDLSDLVARGRGGSTA